MADKAMVPKAAVVEAACDPIRWTRRLIAVSLLVASVAALHPWSAFAHGAAADHAQGAAKGHEPTDHGESVGEPGKPGTRGRMVQLTASDDMRYSPSRVTATRNETIQFLVENIGGMKHEMVLGTQDELVAHARLMQQFPEMEHEDPNAVGVEPGKTATLTWKFTNAGTFMFGCLVPGHFESGMKGTIVVK